MQKIENLNSDATMHCGEAYLWIWCIQRSCHSNIKDKKKIYIYIYIKKKKKKKKKNNKKNKNKIL